MKIYDLSHPLNNQSPVYPGKKHPFFSPVSVIKTDGYRETNLCLDSHVGTHIDAPAHMLKNGKTLDELPISAFNGMALIVHISNPIKIIETQFLMNFEKEINDVEFVLFKTGWSKFWGTEAYFKDFPTLSNDATEWLTFLNLKGIGFDTISADPVESTNWKNHFTIFKNGLIIIENLIFPVGLNKNIGEFSCFPIPYEKADGSPVRAVIKVF